MDPIPPTTPITPIVPLHSITPLPRSPEFRPSGATAERFDANIARLSAGFGLKRLGCNVTVLPPGKAAFPMHSHRANDELFLILAGSGELRLGAARHAVKQGDLIGCPAGNTSTAHQLINTGEVELRYLAVSSTLDPEICEYPDSGKVGAYCGDEVTGLEHLTRYADQVDYWDRE